MDQGGMGQVAPRHVFNNWPFGRKRKQPGRKRLLIADSPGVSFSPWSVSRDTLNTELTGCSPRAPGAGSRPEGRPVQGGGCSGSAPALPQHHFVWHTPRHGIQSVFLPPPDGPAEAPRG